MMSVWREAVAGGGVQLDARDLYWLYSEKH